MQDHDAALAGGHVDGACNPVAAPDSHLPELVPKRLDVGLSNLVWTELLDQTDDVVELGLPIRGKFVEFFENRRVQDLDTPSQSEIISVLISMTSGTIGLLARRQRRGGRVAAPARKAQHAREDALHDHLDPCFVRMKTVGLIERSHGGDTVEQERIEERSVALGELRVDRVEARTVGT